MVWVRPSSTFVSFISHIFHNQAAIQVPDSILVSWETSLHREAFTVQAETFAYKEVIYPSS